MNSKNRKIILLIVAALVVAISGSVALYFYLVPQKVTVYVFKYNVSAGEIITEDMLIAVQADADIYVAGVETDISDRFVTGENIDNILKSGDSLRMDVTAGMPLTLSLLSTSGGTSIEMTMNPEKIAVTVPINDVTGVTYDLKNGSRVNVYVTGAFTDGTISTLLLFENMRVLSTNQHNGSLSSVTLEVSIEESLKLVYYTTVGSIYLGLIDSTGYEYSNTDNPSYSPTSNNNYIDTYEQYQEPTTENPINTTTEPITEITPDTTNEVIIDETTEASIVTPENEGQ